MCDNGACEEYVAVVAHPMFSRMILMRDHGWLCTANDRGEIEDLCEVHGADFVDEVPINYRGNVAAYLHSFHPDTGRYALGINSYVLVCSVAECPSKAFGISGESMRATLVRLTNMGWKYRRYGWGKMKMALVCPDHQLMIPDSRGRGKN